MPNTPETHVDPNLLQDLGYEPRDIALSTIVKWVGWLFVFIAITSLVALGIYFLLVRRAPGVPGPQVASPLVPEARRTVSLRRQPPEPILQAYPKRDMREFRRSEQKALHSYGWVAQDKGIAHIPIERAIDITAERGLPVSGAATARPQPETGIRSMPRTTPSATGQRMNMGLPTSEPGEAAEKSR